MLLRRIGLPVLILLAAGCKPQVNLLVGPDDSSFADLVEGSFQGIVGVPNIDDDNENGDPDWEDWDIREDNDLASFVIPADVASKIRDSRPLRITMNSGAGDVRVWQAGRIVLGENEDEDRTTSLDVARVDSDVRYQVEFRTFLARATFNVSFLNARGDALSSVDFEAVASPLVMNQHLQPAEEVMAVEVSFGGTYNNAAMISDYQDALGDRFLTLRGNDYGGDVWIQDEIEFASMAGGGSRIDLVIDSIRDRGLDDVPEDHYEGPEFLVETWGEPNFPTSQDSFGNLEATPPVTVDGRHYPFGRVYWGDSGGQFNVVQELQDMFGDQVVQAPFELDTSWLFVGHVDEFMSWIPDPSAPKGWRLVYTDIQGAWDVLEGMDPNTPLPRYDDGHGFDTVGEIVEDQALRNLNEDLWEDYLEPNLEILRREAGVTDEDILWLPGLFEVTPQCGGATAALIPGMANLIVANVADEPTKIFLADPFLRQNDNDQSSDPMIERVTELFPPDFEMHFVDDFYVYHLGLGEVHCGTNVVRTPVSGWADHVLPFIEED